jgi:hypothetical protein
MNNLTPSQSAAFAAQHARLDAAHTAALNLRDALDSLNLNSYQVELVADELEDALDAWLTFGLETVRKGR